MSYYTTTEEIHGVRVTIECDTHPERQVIYAQDVTVGRPIQSSRVTWSVDKWINKLVAGHSTMKIPKIRIIFDGVRSDVARQLVRHTRGFTKSYMESKRPDLVGAPRPKEPYPCKLILDTTAMGWIEIAKQRLCTKAMKETREIIMSVVLIMNTAESNFLKALAKVSAPPCTWYGACPEEKSCGLVPVKLSVKLKERYENTL